MAREILIIGQALKTPEGLVIAVNSGRLELRNEWRQSSCPEVEDRFKGKSVKIIGDEYSLSTEVLAVKVSSSLANFKNIYLKIKENALTSKIQELDELEIDL